GSGDCRGRGVPLLPFIVAKVQIPAADPIGRQMIQKIPRELPRRLTEAIVARMPVGKREPVDTPGLSARPAGLIGMPLVSSCIQWCSCLGIHEACMASGAVAPHEQTQALIEMTQSHVMVREPLACPGSQKQKRHVHGTVDDNASPFLRVTEPAPRLNYPAALPESGCQQVRGTQHQPS